VNKTTGERIVLDHKVVGGGDKILEGLAPHGANKSQFMAQVL
jgi:hypothetical protein